MTPHNALTAEIYLVAVNAETAASLLRLKHAVDGFTPAGALEDARTEVIGRAARRHRPCRARPGHAAASGHVPTHP